MSNSKGNPKHGLRYHPLYSIWKSMKVRCFNANCRAFKDYGGRGVTVCEEWKDNPKAFVEWGLANGWQIGLTIDRINNDGNYEPENCRFATYVEQRQNQRPRHVYKNRELPLGVYPSGNRFQAKIRKDNKNHYLGTFSTLEEAQQAVCQIRNSKL